MVWLLACYAYLYAPIAFLITMSFNADRSVTAWAGFSLRWYQVLFHDRAMIDAALLSLRVAAVSACLAVVIGTLAGLALARFGRFRSRAALEAALRPVGEAARALGAGPGAANLLTVEVFAHAAGLLLLAHTGRIRMFGASAPRLMEAYVEDRIARLAGQVRRPRPRRVRAARG